MKTYILYRRKNILYIITCFYKLYVKCFIWKLTSTVHSTGKSIITNYIMTGFYLCPNVLFQHKYQEKGC